LKFYIICGFFYGEYRQIITMESEKVNAMGSVAIKNVAMKKNCVVSTSGDKKFQKDEMKT